MLIPDGERAKTLATVEKIYDAMIRRRLDRTATLVAFGGGVVGDVAGFAAATYLRGIRLVQVPTTLLAQVDSAIGGKVGVNLPDGQEPRRMRSTRRHWWSAIPTCSGRSRAGSFAQDSTRSSSTASSRRARCSNASRRTCAAIFAPGRRADV